MLISVIGILVFSGLCIGLLFWKIKKWKKSESWQRKLATAYEQLLNRHGLCANTYEIITRGFIALDKHQKKLVIVTDTHNKLEQSYICLRNICETRVVEDRDGNGNIKKISLQLQHCSTDTIYEASFFDITYDSIVELPAMAKKALHWKYRCDLYRQPVQEPAIKLKLN